MIKKLISGIWLHIVSLFILVTILGAILLSKTNVADATAPVTPTMLKDIWFGSGNSSPGNFFTFQDKVFFVADTEAEGTELWVTDGTTEGTQMIKDIWPGTASSSPRGFFTAYGKMFFTADNGSNGRELWVTDGTTGGTYLFIDLDGMIYNSSVNSVLELSGKTYFVGNGDLWLLDTSPVGTVKVTDFVGPSYGQTKAQMAVIFKQEIYLSVLLQKNWTEYGFELWKTDGTPGGEQLLHSTGLKAYDDSYYPYHAPRSFDTIGDLLYFYANDTVHGEEFWRTDGTSAGTFMLQDTGTGSSIRPKPLQWNGQVYFGASSGGLWSTDGSQAGTKLVKTVVTLDGLSIYKDQIFFIAPDSNLPMPSWSLWKSDGTTEGTVPVKNIEGISNVPYQQVGDRLLIFNDYTGLIWESDGTTEGTQPLPQFGPVNSNPVYIDLFFPRYAGKVYFVYDNGIENALWASDGTEAGTVKQTAITYVGGPYKIVNNILYFSGYDSTTGFELWKYQMPEPPSPCDQVYEVPQSECNALVALYQSTGGTQWKNRTNWLETPIPSNWYGIMVANHHVVALTLRNNNLTGTIPVELANLTRLYDPGQRPGGGDGLELDFNRIDVPSPYPSTPPTILEAFLLQKEPDWELHQAVTTTIGMDGGQLISADGLTVVEVPANAVNTTINLEFLPQSSPENFAGNLFFASNSFHLTASDQSGTLENFTFAQAVTIKLNYTDADVAKISEESLLLYYWDVVAKDWKDASTTCSPDSTYIRDISQNMLQVDICHLTEFALFGEGKPLLYLPFVTR